MSIYRLVVDQDRCIACHACEASCKAAHDSAPGISLGTLLVDGPRFEDAAEEATPIIVKHARPEAPHRLCRTGSPGLCFIPATGPAYSALSRAVWKPAQRGAYPPGERRDRLHTGRSVRRLRACQKACPHHLIWVDPRKRKAVKCDQCKDRLDAGLDTPASPSVPQAH